MKWEHKYYIKTFFKSPLGALNKLKAIHMKSGRYDEIFAKQSYYWLYERIVLFTTVIDIGAFIGDTAIYFAMNHNVQTILAFEPLPSSFILAQKMLKNNPLRTKIKLENAFVAPERQKNKLLNKDIEPYMEFNADVDDLFDDGMGFSVPTKSLNSILKGRHRIVIKSDCEGMEKKLFEKADLSNVYAMQIEYHNCEELALCIKDKGLKVIQVEHKDFKGSGYIYAWRHGKPKYNFIKADKNIKKRLV